MCEHRRTNQISRVSPDVLCWLGEREAPDYTVQMGLLIQAFTVTNALFACFSSDARPKCVHQDQTPQS